MNLISNLPLAAGTVAPIVWSELFCGGAWLLRNYDDVASALRDPRLSVRRAGRWINSSASATGSASGRTTEQARLREFRRYLSRSMLFVDGPRHARLRDLVQAEFKPGNVQLQATSIAQTVHALLDRILAGATKQSNGECHVGFDFMQDFARPLPTLVIAAMLGISVDQQMPFVEAATAIATFIGSPTPTMPIALAAQQALLDMVAFFDALLQQRSRQAGATTDDLIGRLLQAADEGKLSRLELLAQCCTLLFAGYETTRNLLGNGLLALLQHPTQWQALQHSPAKLPRAIKELLRYDSPVQYTGRRLLADMTLHGQHLRRGDLVILDIGAANHDPRRFTCPAQLDIERDEGSHLSFGHGPHVCLGAALTLIETEITLRALLQRMPSIKLVPGGFQREQHAAYRGLAALPVTCVSTANQAPTTQEHPHE